MKNKKQRKDKRDAAGSKQAANAKNQARGGTINYNVNPDMDMEEF